MWFVMLWKTVCSLVKILLRRIFGVILVLLALWFAVLQCDVLSLSFYWQNSSKMLLCGAADEGKRSNVRVHIECTESNSAAYGAATSWHLAGLFARVSENKEQHPCCEAARGTARSCLPWQQVTVSDCIVVDVLRQISLTVRITVSIRDFTEWHGEYSNYALNSSSPQLMQVND